MTRLTCWSVALLSAMAVACSTGSTGGEPIARVVLSEETRVLVINGTHQFTAIAQDAAGQPVNAAITWSSTSTAALQSAPRPGDAKAGRHADHCPER